jgi:hypothetical protein
MFEELPYAIPDVDTAVSGREVPGVAAEDVCEA